MITLILSNLITVTDYQKILAVITLIIDIVSSIILLWRVIKSRKISDETLKKIAQKGKLNKRNLLTFVSELNIFKESPWTGNGRIVLTSHFEWTYYEA